MKEGLSGFNPTRYKVAPILFHQGKLFVERWHYTHAIGIAEFLVGMFHETTLVGVITFGHPSGRTVASSILQGGTNKEVWELRRMVLLDSCPRNSESWLIAKAIKLLKQQCPHVLILIAFADCNVGHTGLVYKASSWLPYGQTAQEWHYITNIGIYVNKRAVWNRSRASHISEKQQALNEGLTYVKDEPKNRFLRILRPKEVKNRLSKKVLKCVNTL